MEPEISLDPTRGIWKESRPIVPPRYYFGTREKAEKYLPRKWWHEAKTRSEEVPVQVFQRGGTAWWRYRGDVYVGAAPTALSTVQALADAQRATGAQPAEG